MELLVANDVVRAVGNPLVKEQPVEVKTVPCPKNAICGRNNAGNSPTGEGTRM